MSKYWIKRAEAAIRQYVLKRAENNDIFAEYHRRSANPAEWKRQAEVARAREMKDWKRALMAATDPERPRRGELWRFYVSMLYDNHLSSTIDNRVLPVKCAPFKLVDDAGNEDTAAHKLLEKPWYLDLAECVSRHTFEGTKLLEMIELNENLELARVTEIPPTNFIPQDGVILREESDETGVSYKEGVYRDYYVQVGGDWALGMLNQMALIVIAKKLGLGAWMNFIDRFGVPPIFAVTDRLDAARRDELFAMLESFQMNQFAVLQGNEKIEVPSNYNIDAHNTFKSLITDVANSEMSKRILGSTGMTDEKSFVGSAEVGERLFQYRIQVDKLMFQYYFNEEVKPRLVKLSPVYAPLEKLTFVYDESENMTVKEVIEAIAKLAGFFEFDVAELAKVTGLPITAVKSYVSGQLAPADKKQTVPEEKEKPAPEGSPENETEGKGQKKKISRSDPDGAMALAGVIAVQAAAWDTAIEKVARQLFRGEIQPADLDRDCVLKTYAELNKTAAAAWGKEYFEHPVARRMRDNLMKFAGAKAYQMLEAFREARGRNMSEGVFVELAQDRAKRYNGAWLDTEKRNTANAASAARNWQGYVADMKTYRNLKYRTMGDAEVRSSHRALEGMILPKGHPGWATLAPPNGQGCRCWLEETNEGATEEVQIEIEPQFRHNPGADGMVFNGEASYFRFPNKDIRLQVHDNSERMKFYAPYGKTEKAGTNHVYVSDFADAADLEVNLAVARQVAREIGKDVYIRPHIQVEGQKNPELAIGTEGVHGDVKNYRAQVKGREVSLKSFVKNGLQAANRQGCTYAVLNLADERITNIEQLPRILGGELKGINRNIRQVIIIQGEKVVKVSRREVEQGKFKGLESLT